MIRNQSGTETAKECLAFIDESVSCFHAVENVTKKLLENGFTELSEKDKWKLKEGESYFIKRNDSSIIAFRLPEEEIKGFHIMASHSDSPAFKLKAKGEE